MTVDVVVKGMTCQGCESVVETSVKMLNGVESVDADRYEGVVHVGGDVEPDDIIEQVELAGYKAEPMSAAEPDDTPEATAQPVIDEMQAEEATEE